MSYSPLSLLTLYGGGLTVVTASFYLGLSIHSLHSLRHRLSLFDDIVSTGCRVWLCSKISDQFQRANLIRLCSLSLRWHLNATALALLAYQNSPHILKIWSRALVEGQLVTMHKQSFMQKNPGERLNWCTTNWSQFLWSKHFAI